MADYHLPKRAFLISLLVALAFPALMFLFFSPLIEGAMISESTEEAYRLADFINEHIGITPKSLEPGGREDSIEKELYHLSSSFGLYEACVLDMNGNIVYSSEEERQGTRAFELIEDRVLFSGQRFSAFRRPGELTAEGNQAPGALVEAYVPVWDGCRAVGSVAVHYNVSEMYSDIWGIKKGFAGLLFALSFGGMVLGAFYLVRVERDRNLKARAEEALAEEQLKAETVFSSMGDNVIIQDRDFNVIYQNAVNRDTYGDRRGEKCHKVYEGLDHVCPGCPVALTYEDGEVHRQEKDVMTPRGRMSFELTSSPMKDHSGKITAGIKVVRDVTDKKKLEEQLRHVQKMEAIGTLTSGISHEFNNLLASIIGFSEMLLDMDPQSDLRKYIEAIYQSGRRAEGLTKGLLAYSHKAISRKEEIPLNRLVQDIELIMRSIVGSNIRLTLELTDEDLTVVADRGQMEQVLVNMITNARDAMPEGGDITIRTYSLAPDAEFIRTHGFGREGDRYCVISVKDTGHGMDRETMDRIFEPFFTTKQVGSGTGLGLSIVYGIVTQQGGFVDVQSSAVDGTEFSIFLK